MDSPDDRDVSVFIPVRFVLGLVDGDIITVTPTGPSDRLTASTVQFVRRTRELVTATVTGANKATPDPFIAHGDWKINRGDHTASAGDLVVGELVRNSLIVSHVVSKADRAGQLRTRALVRFGLPLEETDIAAAPKRAALRPGSKRRDLRDLVTLTIDADHSEDLDDALSVTPADETGAIRVLVHISDVAEHIPAGSELDLSARDTATSIYMPGWRRAMLPRHLSENSLSLLPGEERDALTVEFLVDAEGSVSAVECYESRIRSDLRLSYDLVAEILTGRHVDLSARLGRADDGPSLTVAGVTDSVRWLRTAAARLSCGRAHRGGFDAGRTDPELAVSAQGVPAALGTRSTSGVMAPETAAAHQLIECLMVAANESVAGWLVERNLPGIYRTHEGPDEEGVSELTAFCEHLGFHVGLTSPLSPRALAAVEAQLLFAGPDTEAANDLWQILVRNMPAAKYETSPGRHFGLGSDAYLHFTSPIRRYADLCVHRVIKAHLAGVTDMSPLAADLSGVVGHINESAASAKRAENQLRRMLWLSVIADATADMPSKVFTGRVVSVSARDLRVVLDGTAAWGKVKFSSMRGSWYNLSAGVAATTEHGRVTKLSVGDIVSCRVSEVNEVNSEMVLELNL